MDILSRNTKEYLKEPKIASHNTVLVNVRYTGQESNSTTLVELL